MESSRHSVLVVEDDDATRAFLADNLIADGFGVFTASGAGEGLRAIEVRRPDLVVLDLMLEGARGGLELLDRVRASDGVGSRIDPALPVLVLSGRAAETDRVRGFARGADDYVTKPSYSLIALGSSTTRCRSTPAPPGARAAMASGLTCGSMISPPWPGTIRSACKSAGSP